MNKREARCINSQTFDELNQRYFEGRLPRYQVIISPHLRSPRHNIIYSGAE